MVDDGQQMLQRAIEAMSGPPVAVVAQTIQLPPRLPAICFTSAARDYRLPELVLVAMVMAESGGRSVVSRNRDGSWDVGVAQHNSRSWVPYLSRRYGVTAGDLMEPCQSIRAQAYVLRKEYNHRACMNQSIWCGVGRYHAPHAQANAAVYVDRVQAALRGLLSTGRFE